MSSNKTLMIIGAGKFQVPAICKAKEMKLKVLAIDRDPNAEGFNFADSHEVIDIKDTHGAIHSARRHNIDGVVSIVTEQGVCTAAAVAEALGLPESGTGVALAVTNKAIMRQIFKKHDLSSSPFMVAKTKSEAMEAVKSLELPVVMKPTDNAGSRGVSLIEKMEDLESFFEWASANSRSGEVIVETFLEGTEMTVEALSYKGDHEILAMSSKTRLPFPYCVAKDITYPPPWDEALLSKVRELIKKALTALGVSSGASHSEVMITRNEPFLIEVAGRGGGFGIFSDIVPFVSGVDIVEQCINIAMGREADIRAKCQKAALLRFFSPPLGKLLEVSGLEEARNLPGVHKIELGVGVGDILQPIRCDGDRPGSMIVFGGNRAEVTAIADSVDRIIQFRIENAVN